MLDVLSTELAPRLGIAIGGVALAMIVLVAVLFFMKRRNSPLFIKGGRAREPRLMVLDAAAIDPKRRLVLVRRDNVEHLIMIGGPTDIVIETGITDRASSAPQAQQAVVAAAPVERPKAIPAPVAEVAAPAAQPASLPAAAVEKAAPVVQRVERPVAEPVVTAPPVSSMGNLLYSDEREPLAGAGMPTPVVPERRQAAPVVSNPPLAQAAESVLDQARSRVLSAQPAATGGLKPEDAARALAAKLDAAKAEAARREALRRAQASAQVSTAPVPQATVQQSAIAPASQGVPVAAARTVVQAPAEAENTPSDFEKLLEAELEAGGLLREDGNAPVISVDGRRDPGVTSSFRPDLTVERDIARRLGEMSVDRKS